MRWDAMARDPTGAITRPRRLRARPFEQYAMKMDHPGAVYVGGTIPGWRKSYWANPFEVGSIGIPNATAAVEAYREWLYYHRSGRARLTRLAELRGKNLICSCGRSRPCHADLLLGIANRPDESPDPA